MKKMSLSEAQVSGEVGNVAEALIKAAPALAKLGLDGNKMAAELKAFLAIAQKANAEQEELKRKLKASTPVVANAYHDAQMKASGYLDIVIAAVDKTSDEAANFRRIRSRIARPGPTPEPLPVATPEHTS
ncbi:MAG: hypothetical protein E6K18_05525 [Methanobacteriota archaeon]|nr:MAG: hypothetical protein E6K18_05525 [Euryarchaeota archaeon]